MQAENIIENNSPFRMSTNTSQNKNSLLYFFKINDSLHNELCSLKDEKSNKHELKVTFNKNSGVLAINKEDISSTFPFVLQEKPKDCVFEVSYTEKDSNGFTHLGEVHKYLRFQASDDVFSATKAKLVQEEESFRKHRAKEIAAPRLQSRKRTNKEPALKRVKLNPDNLKTVETTNKNNQSTLKSALAVNQKQKSFTKSSEDSVQQFPRITTDEKLQFYRETFESEYKEYKEVYGRLKDQMETLDQLDKQLKRAEINSEDYKAVCLEISKIYHLLKSDAKCNNRASRCEYLHQRLAHIRERIVEYEASAI